MKAKNSKIYMLFEKYVSVAQLDRAQASDAWCRWFESNRVHQKPPCLLVGRFLYIIKEAFYQVKRNCENRSSFYLLRNNQLSNCTLSLPEVLSIVTERALENILLLAVLLLLLLTSYSWTFTYIPHDLDVTTASTVILYPSKI